MEKKKHNFEIAWAYMPLDKKELNSIKKSHRARPYLLCMDKGSYYYAFPCTTKVLNFDRTNENEKVITTYPRQLIRFDKIVILPKSNISGLPVPLISKDTNEITKKLYNCTGNNVYPQDFKNYIRSLDFYCDESDIIKIDDDFFLIIESNDKEFYMHKITVYPVNNSVLIEMSRIKYYADLSKVYAINKKRPHRYANRVDERLYGNCGSIKDYLLNIPLLTNQKDYSDINSVDPGMVIECELDREPIRLIVLKNENGLMEVLCGTKDKTYTEFKNTCIKNKDIKSFKIISNISDHRLDYYIDKYLPGNSQKLNRKYQK